MRPVAAVTSRRRKHRRIASRGGKNATESFYACGRQRGFVKIEVSTILNFPRRYNLSPSAKHERARKKCFNGPFSRSKFRPRCWPNMIIQILIGDHGSLPLPSKGRPIGAPILLLPVAKIQGSKNSANRPKSLKKILKKNSKKTQNFMIFAEIIYVFVRGKIFFGLRFFLKRAS